MFSKDALKDYPMRWVTRKLSNPYFMALQKEQIDELTLADRAFPAELRFCALKAVQSHDLETVRYGLSALAFVGLAEDAIIVQSLVAHTSKSVSQDAKTCLFEIMRWGRRV